jgi:hypothetical protein
VKNVRKINDLREIQLDRHVSTELTYFVSDEASNGSIINAIIPEALESQSVITTWFNFTEQTSQTTQC